MKLPRFVFLFCILFPGIAYSQNTLDGFISYALVNSPAIIARKNNLRLSSLDSALFRAGLKTQISSQNTAYFYPVINGFGGDPVLTNGQQIGSIISFDKEVLFKKQMQTNLNSIQVNRNLIENSLSISKKDLVKAITDIYLTTYGDFLQWQYNKNILELFLQEDSVFLSLTQSNIYKQTDYLLFAAEVSKQRLAVNDALIQYRTDLMNLRYESGIRDTTLVNLKDPSLVPGKLPSRDNSVFFRQYTLDSLQLINDLALISASYKPHLQLHAEAGYLSSLTLAPLKNFDAGIGMSLVIPIYDGKGRQYKSQKVQVQQDNLNSEKENFTNQYDLQTLQLVSLIDDIKRQNRDIDAQLESYDRLIRAEKNLISLGQLDILQYFTVMQNFIDLKNQETVNTVKMYMLINQINYLAN